MKTEEKLLEAVQNIATNLFLLNTDSFTRRAKFYQRIGLTTTMPSKTIQGQSYSIKDLLIKHANGIMPAVNMNGMYDDDPDIDDMTVSEIVHLDRTELDAILVSNQQKISELTKLLTQAQKTDGEKTAETQS